MNSFPRIAAVSLTDKPMTLRLRWERGEENFVDLSHLIQKLCLYAPLRSSPELFRQVRVGEYGTDIVWSDEIDVAADSLWRLAQEQSGSLAPQSH